MHSLKTLTRNFDTTTGTKAHTSRLCAQKRMEEPLVPGGACSPESGIEHSSHVLATRFVWGNRRGRPIVCSQLPPHPPHPPRCQSPHRARTCAFQSIALYRCLIGVLALSSHSQVHHSGTLFQPISHLATYTHQVQNTGQQMVQK